MSPETPAVGVAATSSGEGKTLVSLGLADYFVDQGHSVQSFKVGPDYIDPLFHECVTDRPTITLDYFFSSDDQLQSQFVNHLRTVDVGVIEGVMGLYDGINQQPFVGSTAHVFRQLDIPYVLVVDASSRSHSVAAEVEGFVNFYDGINCFGIILNRVASSRHESMLRESIEERDGPPVFTALPDEEEDQLDSRHLGLDTDQVLPERRNPLDGLDTQLTKSLAKCGRSILDEIKSSSNSIEFPEKQDATGEEATNESVKGGMAFDEAFHFYYERNREELADNTAELVTVSPLHDSHLPADLDFLYIGGGYPEKYAEELNDNTGFKRSLLRQIEDGLPVVAECGGLIYLSRELQRVNGSPVPMLGWLPLRFEMTESIQALGYVKGEVNSGPFSSSRDPSWIGHEFHYSKVEVLEESNFAIRLERGRGITDGLDGITRGNVMGCYSHSYWNGCSSFVDEFIRSASESEREEILA